MFFVVVVSDSISPYSLPGSELLIIPELTLNSQLFILLLQFPKGSDYSFVPPCPADVEYISLEVSS